ncbi:hypothetical protein H0H93_011635, partial [Arthromyces matolae]
MAKPVSTFVDDVIPGQRWDPEPVSPVSTLSSTSEGASADFPTADSGNSQPPPYSPGNQPTNVHAPGFQAEASPQPQTGHAPHIHAPPTQSNPSGSSAIVPPNKPQGGVLRKVLHTIKSVPNLRSRPTKESPLPPLPPINHPPVLAPPPTVAQSRPNQSRPSTSRPGGDHHFTNSQQHPNQHTVPGHQGNQGEQYGRWRPSQPIPNPPSQQSQQGVVTPLPQSNKKGTGERVKGWFGRFRSKPKTQPNTGPQSSSNSRPADRPFLGASQPNPHVVQSTNTNGGQTGGTGNLRTGNPPYPIGSQPISRPPVQYTNPNGGQTGGTGNSRPPAYRPYPIASQYRQPTYPYGSGSVVVTQSGGPPPNHSASQPSLHNPSPYYNPDHVVVPPSGGSGSQLGPGASSQSLSVNPHLNNAHPAAAAASPPIDRRPVA